MSACGSAAQRQFGQNGVRAKQWASHALGSPSVKTRLLYFSSGLQDAVMEFSQLETTWPLTHDRSGDMRTKQFLRYALQCLHASSIASSFCHFYRFLTMFVIMRSCDSSYGKLRSVLTHDMHQLSTERKFPPNGGIGLIVRYCCCCRRRSIFLGTIHIRIH